MVRRTGNVGNVDVSDTYLFAGYGQRRIGYYYYYYFTILYRRNCRTRVYIYIYRVVQNIPPSPLLLPPADNGLRRVRAFDANFADDLCGPVVLTTGG